jgi:hypothetical protein
MFQGGNSKNVLQFSFSAEDSKANGAVEWQGRTRRRRPALTRAVNVQAATGYSSIFQRNCRLKYLFSPHRTCFDSMPETIEHNKLIKNKTKYNICDT